MAQNRLKGKDMDKRTKRHINKKVLDFERECLIEMLFESDDENVKDALEQALLAVKLVHSEEIAEEVEEHRQKLIDEAKNTRSEMERLIKEMERDIERKEQDIWKKAKPYDYWDDYHNRPKWIIDDYKRDRWITTSTVSIDTSPKVIIDPIKHVIDWSSKT